MANLIRVSILGSTAGGELWSVNPVFGITAPGAPVSYADCLAIATAVDGVTVPTNLQNKLNSAQSVTGCRVEARLWDGTLENLADHVRSSAVVGSGAGSHPQQISMVASLRTAFAGPSGRGRLYWPATAVPLTGGTLRIGSSDVTGFLTAMQTYLSGIQTAVQATVSTAGLIVWSRATGTGHYVNKLMAGDIADVQRRRRDKLKENYSSVTFP